MRIDGHDDGGGQLECTRLTRRQLLVRLGGAGAGLLALPAAVAACGGEGNPEAAPAPPTGSTTAPATTAAATTAEPTTGGTSSADIDQLTVSLTALPELGLDPRGWEPVGSAYTSLGLEGLVGYDVDGNLRPLLAESVEQRDERTYVFGLRGGVSFWDGSPLTAEDVVFSLTMHTDPAFGESRLARYFQFVESVEATGEREVTVRLKQPYAPFMGILVFSFVVQKAFYDTHPKDAGTPSALNNGTGPFRFVEYGTDRVSFERNETYWGERPAAKRVAIRVIPEDTTRLLAMRSGEIDGTFNVPLAQAGQWQAIDGVNVQFTSERSTTMLSFAFDQDPWSDVHVRRAIAFCLDKSGLVQAALGGHGRPGVSLVPPDALQATGLIASELDAFLADPYPLDLERARQELAQSSVPDGFEGELLYPNTERELGLVAQSLSENLKQIAVTLNVREVPEGPYIDKLLAHEGLNIVSLQPDTPDPASIPAYVLDPEGAAPGGLNFSSYANPQVGELFRRQFATPDTVERGRLILEMETLARDEVAYLPIWHQDTAMALRSDYTYPYGFSWFITPWAARVSVA